jgi:hypothetical protein
VLQPLFVWERVGAVGPGAAGNGSLACVPAGAGLNVTTVAAAGGAAVVDFPGLAAGTYLAQPLAAVSRVHQQADNLWIGEKAGAVGMIGTQGHLPRIFYAEKPFQADGPLHCVDEILFFVFDR